MVAVSREGRGGARNVSRHTCIDGQVREIKPIYFRDEGGTRAFRRGGWYCPSHCGYPWSVRSGFPVGLAENMGDGSVEEG